MHSLVRLMYAAVVVLCISLPLAGQGTTLAEATAQIRDEFNRLDLDEDRKLDDGEFLRRDGDRDVLRRDFGLYDLDASGFLSSTEFAAVSGLVKPFLRGNVPDPHDQLVGAAVAALDESYEGWNQRPGELVNAHTFVANFLGSISPGSKLFVTGRILRQADQDADGRLSRREAKRFLQQQLGFHWYEGPPLRESTGRLVRFDWFLDADLDQSGSLSRDEHDRAMPEAAKTASDFFSGDRDGNGQISYAEFAHPESDHYFDPIEWFRAADRNLSGTLDAAELFAASDDERRHLVASTMNGFDTDGDGQLGLQEYRLSMLGNVNFSWHRRPVDGNRDGRLSYAEFQFHSFDLFHLQRRYFFHRLDRDSDGYLAQAEFSFQSRLPDGVHLLGTDDEPSRLLFRDPDFPHCGSPVMSPDGRTVLFHRQRPDDEWIGQIMRFDIESGELTMVIDGLQPSWSRDAARLVCSRRTEQKEVWIVSLAGTDAECIAEGWSAKWSPDGRFIAYLHDNGLWIHDVSRGVQLPLLQRNQHDYLDLGDDIAWSPDSQRIAVAGRTTEQSDLVVISVGDVQNWDVQQENTARGDPKWVVRHQTNATRRLEGPMDWSHRHGVVLRMRNRIENTSQLVAIGPDSSDAPTPADWLPKNLKWKSACVSPDGIWYTAISDE